MNFILLLCAIQVVCGEKWDFYHELSVETLQPPSSLREDSYFGFSTTYDRYNKRLMISAPRENNIGEVYECDLNKISDSSCSKVPTTITREAEFYTHDYWFGATVKAGPSYVMACTPRYTRFPGSCTLAGTFGRCYKRMKSEKKFGYPLYPASTLTNDLSISPNKSPTKKCEFMEKTMDSLGWSLDIGNDNSVIIGSPAMFNNTGTAAVLPSTEKLLKRVAEIDKNVLSNFGYGVAAGNFILDNKVSYAVSTTYGNVGSGQVYFYNKNLYKEFDKPQKLNKGDDMNVVGSMFGAVLCAAKINEKGKGDDLLVGAPTYTLTSSYNTGAVYVYTYVKKGVPPTFKRKIIGHKHGSMFGSAIITVGDLNGDKRDEIAIGAPYEDDGAVYLYSGAAIYSDTPLKWLQKLTPNEKNLTPFGYSLTALKDYDNNGCNELAVGAPYNNKVKLYKCLASVIIKETYAIFPNVTNRVTTNQTDFSFQVCMDVQYPKIPRDIIADLSTDVKLIHMHARLKHVNAQNVYTFKTQLQSKKATYCEKVDFILPPEKDYSTEVEYEISTKLDNSPMNMKHVTGAHVILSDNSKLSRFGSFWAGECSGVGECLSNLSLTITSVIKERPFIIGTHDSDVLHVQVLNTGKVAYDPCIQIRVLGGTLQKSPMYCSFNNSLGEMWLCKTMKPIRTNATWEISDITIDLRDLTNLDEEVAMEIKLFAYCADRNNSESFKYSIPLKSNSDGIHIIGNTGVGHVNINDNEVLFPKRFEQIYMISNKGPTNFKNLATIITIEKTDFIKFDAISVSINIDGTSRLKSIHDMCIPHINDLKMTATCPMDRLFKGSLARVIISMDTNPDVLTYDLLKKQDNVSVNSTVTVYFNADELTSFKLSTIIHLWEAFVDLWILIAAGLVGILLIVAIAIMLYKNGFLQRKNKRKLESMKKDVKRQTMRQSMMMRPSGDRQQILEGIEIAEEQDIGDHNPHCSINEPTANIKI